ncbi:hypothetical protein NDU88_003725 [Pleurodeles waltl]|uniref:Uncharacterized protein n=1 Tax=Pleurodeles waltl TaxID=8319 RepID=A0AAV7MV48_PLEWA|nr:hypothetical protein NDU88_003725 [Pleurodeles waltl]
MSVRRENKQICLSPLLTFPLSVREGGAPVLGNPAQRQDSPDIGEDISLQQRNITSEKIIEDLSESQQESLVETNLMPIQLPSLESLLHSLSIEVRQGFLVSQTNQKGIQEVCEALATNMDLLTQRTQILEKQVVQLNEMVEKHTSEIEVLKTIGSKKAERLEVLENNARRKNIKIMNVPEGAEGDNTKSLVVDLLKQKWGVGGARECVNPRYSEGP